MIVKVLILVLRETFLMSSLSQSLTNGYVMYGENFSSFVQKFSEIRTASEVRTVDGIIKIKKYATFRSIHLSRKFPKKTQETWLPICGRSAGQMSNDSSHEK